MHTHIEVERFQYLQFSQVHAHKRCKEIDDNRGRVFDYDENDDNHQKHTYFVQRKKNAKRFKQDFRKITMLVYQIDKQTEIKKF